MKNRILMFLATSILLFGCTPKHIDSGQEKEDSIDVTPTSLTFESEGGEEDAIITSTGDWSVAGKAEYDWVSVSPTSGVDGDIVTFKVESNNKKDRNASFVFTCGESTFTFKVFSYAGEGGGEGEEDDEEDDDVEDKITLLSDSELSFSHAEQQFAIKVSTKKCHYRDIDYIITGENYSWLTHRVTLIGEDETDADLYFKTAALEGLNDRSVLVNIFGPNLDAVTVKVTQRAARVIQVPQDKYEFSTDGETINIPVTTNVAYKISITGADGWLTYGTATQSGIPFTATALTSGNMRTATVTFTQTDAEPGETPISKSITISQIKSDVITTVANMKNNYFDITWNNGKNMSELETLTVEWLMRGDKWTNSNNNQVSSIFGVEQEGQSYSWLIRVGDIDIGDNQLQIARSNGQSNTHWSTGVKFDAGKWYHVAFTYNKATGYAKVYVNGELKAENSTWANANINLSQYCRISKSYDNSRYIEGCLSEIRVWSVERSAAEIAANIYGYNGDKTNLLGYWKLNEGTGKTVSDYSGHNQTLTAAQSISWENVSLPEK